MSHASTVQPPFYTTPRALYPIHLWSSRGQRNFQSSDGMGETEIKMWPGFCSSFMYIIYIIIYIYICIYNHVHIYIYYEKNGPSIDDLLYLVMAIFPSIFQFAMFIYWKVSGSRPICWCVLRREWMGCWGLLGVAGMMTLRM